MRKHDAAIPVASDIPFLCPPKVHRFALRIPAHELQRDLQLFIQRHKNARLQRKLLSLVDEHPAPALHEQLAMRVAGHFREQHQIARFRLADAQRPFRTEREGFKARPLIKPNLICHAALLRNAGLWAAGASRLYGSKGAEAKTSALHKHKKHRDYL